MRAAGSPSPRLAGPRPRRRGAAVRRRPPAARRSRSGSSAVDGEPLDRVEVAVDDPGDGGSARATSRTTSSCSENGRPPARTPARSRAADRVAREGGRGSRSRAAAPRDDGRQRVGERRGGRHAAHRVVLAHGHARQAALGRETCERADERDRLAAAVAAWRPARARRGRARRSRRAGRRRPRRASPPRCHRASRGCPRPTRRSRRPRSACDRRRPRRGASPRQAPERRSHAEEVETAQRRVGVLLDRRAVVLGVAQVAVAVQLHLVALGERPGDEARRARRPWRPGRRRSRARRPRRARRAPRRSSAARARRRTSATPTSARGHSPDRAAQALLPRLPPDHRVAQTTCQIPAHRATTTDSGIPAASDEHSLTVGPAGPIALHDHYVVQKMQHFNRERVPERVVHAKGGGAHGFFEVTATSRSSPRPTSCRPSASAPTSSRASRPSQASKASRTRSAIRAASR